LSGDEKERRREEKRREEKRREEKRREERQRERQCPEAVVVHSCFPVLNSTKWWKNKEEYAANEVERDEQTVDRTRNRFEVLTAVT
jgi:hypothetical protein